jgi:hypothetical protein
MLLPAVRAGAISVISHQSSEGTPHRPRYSGSYSDNWKLNAASEARLMLADRDRKHHGRVIGVRDGDEHLGDPELVGPGPGRPE